MTTENDGLRYNDGKPRWDLMPFDALDVLADHYRKGAEKYAERNWEKGMSYSSMLASLLRHASAFAQGEDIDPENGSLHSTAMAWNALGLLTYQLRNIGIDDRVKLGRQEQAPQAQEEPHREGLALTEVRGQVSTCF